MAIYGTAQSSLGGRELNANEVMEPGKIYQATFDITGLKTFLPGWEDDVMFTMRDALYQKNCEPVYLEVDGQNYTAIMQYRLMDTGNATAMIEPITVGLLIIFVASIVVGLYLISLTLNGGVKELSATMADNPVITPVVYGGVAIAGIVALIYLKNKFS